MLLLARFVAVMVVLVFHEFSHAFVAYKCGDPTAKFSGRMSLNPLKHFDPLGIVAFMLVGFGWAKPVPVNPNNFKKYRSGCFWTSAAGILTNLCMAFVLYPVYLLVAYYLCPMFEGMYAAPFLRTLFSMLFSYSLSFCVFNLLPFYPLDGFRMIDALDRKKGKLYRFLRQYGYYILLGLMLISMLARYIPVLGYIDLLGYIMNFAVKIVGQPIRIFWLWIFSFFA